MGKICAGLVLLIVCLGIASPAYADDDEEARARIDKALEAAGTDVARVFHVLESRDPSFVARLGSRGAMRKAVMPPALVKAERDAHSDLLEAARALTTARAGGRRRDVAEAARAERAARDTWARAVSMLDAEARKAVDPIAPEPALLAGVQQRLEPDEALVVFHVGAEHVRAVVVERSRATQVVLGSAASIREATERTRAILTRNGDPDDLQAIQSMLFAPLSIPDTVKRLVIVPDDVIRAFPFALLCSDRSVTVTASATAHHMLREGNAGTTEGVLAVGDPKFSSPRLVPLPASGNEARAVGDRVLFAASATESGLREAVATGTRWRSVHLATHVEHDTSRPVLSSIVMGTDDENDGHLTALEIARLDLPADLVVISDCGTPPQGDANLPVLVRAFLEAGASGVLTSVTQVDVQAALEFMQTFYALWNPKDGEGLDAATALCKAQQHVRTQEGWAHPFYWAGWTLYGAAR